MDESRQRIDNLTAVKAYQAFHRFLERRESLLRLYLGRLTLRLSLSTHRRRKGRIPPRFRRFQRRLQWLKEKVCIQCLMPKPLKEFHRDVNQPFGRSPRCKTCATSNMQDWLAVPGNRERTRVYSAEQRERNEGNEEVRQYHLRYGKAWDQNNRDKRHIYERRSRLKRQQAPMIETVDIQVLYARDKGICSLCLKPVDMRLKFPHPESPTVDHIIPLSRGGEESYRNTALAHFGCNTRKNNREVTQQMRLF